MLFIKKNYFKSYIGYISCIFSLFFVVAPFLVVAQAKQPILSNKVVRIAYVNHLKIRQQFGAFQASQSKGRQEWQSSQEAFKQEKDQLEAKLEKEVYQDSLDGGQKQRALEQKADVDRQALKRKYELQWEKQKQARLTALQAIEKQIIITIGEVVAEGGFTEVKSIDKDTDLKKGTDITILILNKLK